MPPARPATAAPRRHPRPAPRKRPRLVARPPKLRVRWERVGRIGLLVVLTVVVGLYVEHTLSYVATHAQAGRQQAIVTKLTRQNAAADPGGEGAQHPVDDRLAGTGARHGAPQRAPLRDHGPAGSLIAPRAASGAPAARSPR